MTRINTNVSSLVGRNNLNRANAGLSEALTRLSTGLRINTGKDDPAGLIASENLRSDITSIRRAISNTDRANQVIATADSSLGQVSSLLNDIRGLVTESANAGALSDEQIAANQLQVDSSLAALNRIAQTTTFQGRRLLDGSLDFITSAGTNFTNVSDLQIDQANLGATGSVSVDIDVTTAATQALVDVESIPASGDAAVTASDGTLTFQTAGVQAGLSAVTLTNGSLAIDATAAGGLDGTAGNIDVVFDNGEDGNGDTASLAFDGSTLTISIDDGATTLATIETAINTFADAGNGVSAGDLDATVVGSGVFATADIATFGTSSLTGGVDEVDATITIAATDSGATFNRTITFADNGAASSGIAVTDDGTTLAIVLEAGTDIDLSTLATDIETALDANDDFDVTLTDTTGDGQFNSTEDTDPTAANVGATTAGADATTGGLTAAVTFELSGADGSEVLSFGVGTTIGELVAGINLVSDATGVSAAANGTTTDTLDLTSTAYGSDAFVDIKIISEGTGSTPAGTFTTAVAQGERNSGSDIVASVNGVVATGDGNNLAINTSTLDLAATIDSSFTGTASFTITGGGALFQLGPDVVSNQQARLGVGSVNTARLGGVSGKLFQLGSGGSADLATDTTTAARIVEEAIDQVTSLRGRLGAFQRTTLETNKNALNDTLTNLTEAESSIRDADFAAETANLTRSQILVQSGTRVLAIANQNPQNALALLG